MIAELPFPRTPPTSRGHARVERGLIVDSFAGGGGASLGIERALGRPVDIAINHDEAAITMHRANHPGTKHLCESVWKVDPREVCAGRPVELMWLSPNCTHFSRAKGSKPVSKKIRGLAWLACTWAKAVRPRVIAIENVLEWEAWGPLLDNDMPNPDRKGHTFRHFVARLRNLGYDVDWRALNASEFGAPTHRRRLLGRAQAVDRVREGVEELIVQFSPACFVIAAFDVANGIFGFMPLTRISDLNEIVPMALLGIAFLKIEKLEATRAAEGR